MSASKARGIALASGLVLAGVVVAAAAIPWLRQSDGSGASAPFAAVGGRNANESPSPSDKANADRTSVAEVNPATTDAPTSAGSPNRSADSVSDRLVGAWQLEKHGLRTLTIFADGTARVDVRLDLLGSLLYGAELSLDLTWTFEEGVMTQSITGGEPEKSVARLIRDWGDERRYRVVKVTDKRLVLAELDDDNDRDIWTAVGHQDQIKTTAPPPPF